MGKMEEMKMSSFEKVQEIFKDVFAVEASVLNETFTSDAVEGWDSVTQMALVSALEENFDIMLDIDDIYELTSFKKCLDILKKYGVEL